MALLNKNFHILYSLRVVWSGLILKKTPDFGTCLYIIIIIIHYE